MNVVIINFGPYVNVHTDWLSSEVAQFSQKMTFISLCFIEFSSKYSLKDIVNVEENHDVMKGDRYLIDLVSQYHITNLTWKMFLISRQLL